MKKPSASTLERALACPASHVLPQSPSDSVAAQVGTDVHRFLQQCLEVGRDAALAAAPEDLVPALEALDLSELPLDRSDFAAEVMLGYDVIAGTARELGRGAGRSYPDDLLPSEMVGTADVLGLTADRVLVFDYKTGRAGMGRPETSAQLAFLALAACRAYGRSAATVGLVHVPLEGEPSWRVAELGPADLEAFAGSLEQLLVRLRTEEELAAGTGVTPRRGPHCDYCPAFHACPAQVSLARAALGAEPLSLVPLDAEHAAELYDRIQAFKIVVKRVESAIYAIAAREDVALGEGRYLGLRRIPGRETLDADVTFAVVGDILGDLAAFAATRRTTTKKLVEQACREYRLDGTSIADAKAEVLDEIRRRGGARRPARERVVEFTRVAALAEEEACQDVAQGFDDSEWTA